MKLWKRFFQKMSLLKKLLFIFILVMIAPLCLTTVSFYQRTEQRLLEITYENMNSSIQQIRSNVRAQMELLQHEVLKLILQPFVENAINHAQTAGDSPLHITIRAYAVCRDKKTSRCLEVIDDGCGMPEEKAESILNAPSSKGYGILNVHKRIRLAYGDDYGVSISSKTGQGTKITLLLPM